MNQLKETLGERERNLGKLGVEKDEDGTHRDAVDAKRRTKNEPRLAVPSCHGMMNC